MRTVAALGLQTATKGPADDEEGLDPLGRIWREGLAHLPTADLVDEREYVTRRIAELLLGLDGGFCSGLVAVGPLIERYEQRASWLDGELARRARLDASVIRFAPRRIPAPWIEDLRGRTDLGVFVVHDWPETRLRKSGGSLVGHCPLHDDHSPSFHVWPGQSRFHCFGCGADGDIFDLLLSSGRAREFRQAVEQVANWAEVAMPAPTPYRLGEAP